MSVNTKVNGQLVPSAGLYKVSVPIQSSDIYSEQERQVGVWVDGKPLYQKTINLGTMPNNTSKTVAHGISNLDSVISFQGYYKNSNSGSTIPLSFTHRSALNEQLQLSADNTNITVITATDKTALTECYITIQYTKTTDVAGSGIYVPSGDKAVHYSTDEQVIGTWINGETLYRKTLYFQSGVSISMTGWTDVNSDIPNIGYSQFIHVYSMDSNGTYQGELLCGLNASNHVQMQSTRNGNASIEPNYITLEYTKTS